MGGRSRVGRREDGDDHESKKRILKSPRYRVCGDEPAIGRRWYLEGGSARSEMKGVLTIRRTVIRFPARSRKPGSYGYRRKHHPANIVLEALVPVRICTQHPDVPCATERYSPFMTFPRAVFLKNFRCVTTASVLGRFLTVISTICSSRGRDRCEKVDAAAEQTRVRKQVLFPVRRTRMRGWSGASRMALSFYSTTIAS